MLSSGMALLRLLAAAALLAALAPAADAQRPLVTRDRVYAALAGRWTGTLEYRDYQDPTRRVTLPTTLEVVRGGDGLELRYTYDDGPGKTVRSAERLVLDVGVTAMQWGGPAPDSLAHWTVLVLGDAPGPGTIRFVAQRDGLDDGRPARLRETFTIGRTDLHILKEVREPGTMFAVRHQYRLKRTR